MTARPAPAASAGPEVDDVFRALADPSRRLLLDRLNADNGQTLRELCAALDMARQSVSKHLAVLEAADLVTTLRRGREKLHYLNAAPINAIAERWINHYDQSRVRALSDLKNALEGTPMTRPTFVYTTYINTTPEQLWQALTDPAFTRATGRRSTRLGGRVDRSPGTTTASSSPTPTRSCSNPSPTAGWPTPGTPSPRSWPRRFGFATTSGPSWPPSAAPGWPSTSSPSARWSS